MRNRTRLLTFALLLSAVIGLLLWRNMRATEAAMDQMLDEALARQPQHDERFPVNGA